MRFYTFTLCFFCSLFLAKAENKLLDSYAKRTCLLENSITDSVISFIPTSYTYQILTTNYIYSINLHIQNIYTKTALTKQTQNIINQEYSDNFKSDLLYYILNELNFCENKISLNNYRTPYSSIAILNTAIYATRNDSLFRLNKNSAQFIYYPVSRVYQNNKSIFLWSKTGSLFEINTKTVTKRYTTERKLEIPYRIIKSDNNIFAIYKSPIKIIQLHECKHNTIYTNSESIINSIAVFDSKIFILQQNGVLSCINTINLNINNIDDAKLTSKPVAIANNKNGNLLILTNNNITEYLKPEYYNIQKHNYVQIIPTINGYWAVNQKNSLINNKARKIISDSLFKNKIYQIWKDENENFTIINKNGIVLKKKKTIYLSRSNNLLSSYYKSNYEYFWYLDNDTFKFGKITNSKLNIIAQLKNKKDKPQRIETDKAGNLWIIYKDSVAFNSVNQTNIKNIISICNSSNSQLFSGQHNLYLFANQNLYRCTLDGKLIKLKWKGDIDLLPSVTLTTLRENTNNEWIGTCSSLQTNSQSNLFKFKITDDVINSKIITHYDSKHKTIYTYDSAIYINIVTEKEIIKIKKENNNYQNFNIKFFTKKNSYHITNSAINSYTNNIPSYIYFQGNNANESKDGIYQIKFEPFDSTWSNYSENKIYPLPKLHKGIYKLHIRYCINNGQILGQSTLLLNIKGNRWTQNKFLFLYFVLFIAFSLLFIQLFYKIKISNKLKTEELINQRTTIINEEKHKLQQLLEAFVPREATTEIIATGKASYQRFEGVTVLFADIQGFSKIAENTDPEILIEQLDDLFYRYDFIVSKYGIEKIKTIGDAYMCAGGLPIKRSANAIEMVLAAIEMLDYIKHLTTRLNFNWKIRIGIHTGKVIAGVVGQKKLSYDIWGDTVNVANRMESSSIPGRINISGETYELVKDFFDCEYRGCIPIKNKGEKDMYFINGIHPWLTENRKPNAEFSLLIQLISLNDLAEIVLSKIDEEMPSNRYFHTADYIHHVYSNAISICKQTELTTEYQLVLQTASLFIFYGMIDHFDQFIEESIAFAKTILPEYDYNSTQIDLICNTLTVINTLKPHNLLETLLLENYYSCWGNVNFPERIKALYIEESELLDRIEWKDWLNLKILQFEQVIKSINTERAQFEINPYTQIQRLRSLKI